MTYLASFLSALTQGSAEDPAAPTSIDWAERGMQLVSTHGPRILAALAILILGWLVAKTLAGVARRIGARAKLEATLSQFLGNLVHMAVLAFTVVAAISKLGVETTSFVAVMGAAGFAVGFALQGSLSNFASGVMLMIFRPLKKDDLVEAGGTMGVVQEVGVFATIINTLDNKRVIVANASVTSANVVNYSANPTRRVDMMFGIGYGEDFEQAKKILDEVLSGIPGVLAEPAPQIALHELGDSSVNLVCRPWCKPEDYWNVYHGTHEAVKREFDRRGIQIPFPQRDVHMHQVA